MTNNRGFRRGGRGRGHGRGRGRGGFKNFHRGEENEWQQSVRENRDAIDIKFEDYTGEKVCELPEDFVQLLNGDKTKATDEKFLVEADMGITKYVKENVGGFSAILKHLCSDFVVREIDLDGEVIKLTDLSLPQSTVKTTPLTDEDIPDYESLSDEDKKLITKLSWTRLVQLAQKCQDSKNEGGAASEISNVKIDVTSKTKEDRKMYHEVIKKLLPNLDTVTVDFQEKKFVETFPRKKPNANEWPRDRPPHLTFTLCKQGIDQSSIFGQLARELGTHNSNFKAAGTKDRRSISTQRVSIKWTTADKLKRAVKSIRGRVYAGNFSYRKESLELGDLKGNQFTIVLRNVQESTEIVDEALKSLKTNGFVNYFGQQRFGTDSTVKTSDIGLALIKKNWKEAVELILRPRGNESPQMTRMRAHWWMYRNPGDAVVLLGSRLTQSKSIEATLLQGLEQQHDNDYVGALGFLQRNTQLLYLHAYQAMLWNKAVSQRLEKFGFEILNGDLVLPYSDIEIKGTEETSKREIKESKLVVVSDENRNEFTLLDVVMPIPGYKVSYPDNEELAKIYNDLLAEDGLDDGFESLKNSVDLYSLPGDYRRIVEMPNNMSWKFVRYNDANKDLLVSDFEEMHGKTNAKSLENGKHLAIVLELCLPSSTYATMALREAMKIDMGKGTQTRLTEAMNATKRKSESGASEEEVKKAKVELTQEVGNVPDTV